MRKEIVILSASLLIPGVTGVLFLLFTCLFIAQGGGAVMPTASPPWLHFLLSHQRLLVKLIAIGFLSSALNAALILAWLVRRGVATTGQATSGHLLTFFWVLGSLLLLAPLGAAAHWIKTTPSSQGAISLGHLDPLILNYLLPLGVVFLVMALLASIALSFLFSAIELSGRLAARKRLREAASR